MHRRIAVAFAVSAVVWFAPANVTGGSASRMLTVRAGSIAQAGPAGPFPGPLPATFSGDLPCADCPGVRHIVELHPDHVFVYRMTYLGRGDDGKGESFDDLGRWVVGPDGTTLTLHGGREAVVAFAITDGRVLRKLDTQGKPIESSLTYDLVRVRGAEPLEPHLQLRGMYSYMADAGSFVECATNWRLPVAMEADNAALERGYREAQARPGEPMLVSLEGRIALRPEMDGPGLRRSLIPVRFINAWPGSTCASKEEDRRMTGLDGTGWRLLDASIGAAAPDDVSRVTLRFGAERLSVSIGCNTGAAAYQLAGGALVTTQFASTRKACVGSLAEWETAFFRFLASTPTIAREADVLLMSSAAQRARWRPLPMPSAAAVQRFIYVAAERKPCTGVAQAECLQIRETPTEPWRLFNGEIIGFTAEPGTEYRLRILEDEVTNPPADGPAKQWFIDLIVEQRVVRR